MSKNLKKILVAGASLLMLASAGAGLSNTTHASEASDFNKLTSMMNNDGHVENYRNGADQGYTVVHNGKRITVTMTHAYINGRKVSYGKALKAFEQKAHKAHIKRHHRKAVKRYRKAKSNGMDLRGIGLSNHKAKRVHARKPAKKARKATHKSRNNRSVRMTPAKAKRAYAHKISMKRLNPSQLGYVFGLEMPAKKSSSTAREYLPINAGGLRSQFSKSYVAGAYYYFKNIKHNSSNRANEDAHASLVGFHALNNYAHHSHANKDYIIAWSLGFDTNKSYVKLPKRFNKYKESSKFMNAFMSGYMTKQGNLTSAKSSMLYVHFSSLFD